MARRSRKPGGCTEVKMPVTVPAKFQTGIYARLSVEDNGYETGDSIQNQVSLLRDFIKKREDELQVAEIYVDNGTTGTNFNREKWNCMLDDIRIGKINCVVVKDFSRLGRSYIEVGDYLEKIFPFLGVRVIAVNENFDSQKQSFENSMLINSLTNIVNEYYARDISKKVTQTKRTMQKKGEYASGVTPYGYKKADGSTRQLVVDRESATVVKKIFDWRLTGKGCTVIANYLNELAVPSPGLYRYMNGNQSFRRSIQAKWKSKHVSSILKNPTYLGNMVQGKTRCSYFEQGGRMRNLPQEDWIVVAGTHEALITQEQYDRVMAMAEESRDRHMRQMETHAGIPRIENILRRKIFCGQCGGRMTRRSRVEKGIRDYCYFCSAPEMKLETHCTNTHVHELPLMEAVTTATDQQLQLLGKIKNSWDMQKQSEEYLRKKRKAEERERKLEESLSRLKVRRQELYADMKEGLLSPGDYEYEKGELSKKLEECNLEMDNLMKDENVENKIEDILGKVRKDVLKLEGLGTCDHVISMELLDALVERIVVFSPERIEITCTFADKLEAWRREIRTEIPWERE